MAIWNRKSAGEEDAYTCGKKYDPAAHTEEENHSFAIGALEMIDTSEYLLEMFPEDEQTPKTPTRRWAPHDEEWELQTFQQTHRERIAYYRGALSRLD